MRPSTPLPLVDGRPPGGGSGYSTPVASAGPSSTIFSSLLASPDPPDAVIEKHRLSTARRPFSILRPFAAYFSPYPMPLPFTSRRLILPVPNVFYPNYPNLAPQNYRSNHPRHSSFGSRRSPDKRSYRLTLFYGLIALTTILLAFSKIRSAIRKSTRRIPLPFQDPSTLILNEQTIRRVWEWEISQGHYPSSRRTPTVVGLTQVPNPGLPRKSSAGLNSASDHSPFTRFDDHVAVPPTRIAQQNQLRAPPSFLDDIIPIGPTRSYLNITAPPVYHHDQTSPKSPPLPYPPRPIPNAIIDLDVVMDYCDFSTNQYVRDCLEILRMGGGLDVEKRVRRGETARWRHVYHEQNDDGSVRAVSTKPLPDYDPSLHTPMDEERGEQMIKDPSYQPIDVLSLLKSDVYPQKLKEIQKQVHNTADSRRKASTRHPSHPTADPTCDIDYPKIFHIFWAGPFTDKPYLALSSFLFTQNLGLHLPLAEPPKGAKMTKDEQENFARRSKFLSEVCRPQMWVWINPGPAAAIPNPNARREMFDDLKDNPWSAPFLHPRFREVIKFKMWNTTEQLDGVPELRDHWRELPLFNSGGVKYGSAPAAPVKSHQHGPSVGANGQVKAPVKIGIVVPEEKAKLADKDGDGQGEAPDVVEEELGRFGNHTRGEAAVAEDMSAPATNPQPETTASASSPVSSSTAAPTTKKSEDELFQRVGSTSSKGYDRLSVVLSDMARFVLCHRFGGIYLDADTILLRDWEEMWGWRGQFAYRWSRLEKYNTAVLRLHRHSAVGSFLFKTALANGLDFHPMTISRYTKDAYLDGLLLRLPDALFDSAWLNTEYYQRDRPAFPYFKRFEDFFDPPRETDAGPAAIGFDGFFRGAFSYHFHNFWWIPFDPSRNFPDLGSRFEHGERVTRAKELAAKQLSSKTKGNSDDKKNDGSNLYGGHQTREELEEELTRTIKLDQDDVADDERDLGWATVLKRTFEAYLRCERPNMYGEWIDWADGQ
ncbi:hypothetical protein PTTG_26179 [Puccinia triticina 1-1 BBBD Race 1]|uniref:Glycosyltransferase family 32 protein n=2 Tax=Puccinia triticina TaxID=208348 RepID=A0A180GWZ2_PUCT1|nr:uncharacterized protein PtA15_6A367 [Puccinia triticina]OAV96889.1 hypothetical protein PTTG_26179 [Puccinia triticina 1-1 BBBD Race 1]WAQ85738.1 hypothetical protein PtA15_6A367 [Puccinia triticina]WAR55612.1 hypothetical protein PtB15_6B355 [Puccinia triticina]